MARSSLTATGALLLAAGLGATCVGAQTQLANSFQGSWEGSLEAGGTRLRILFHVVSGEGGTLRATLDSPDQGATGIPAAAVASGDSTVAISVGSLNVRYEGKISPDGLFLTGTFTQGSAALPLSLARAEIPEASTRPQDPKPPFPYRLEEVRVVNPGAGVTLSGTLTLPPGNGPFPAAVLVSGTGPQDRDYMLRGHRPFLVLADQLTRRGIAVLRYDDRGTGASTGNFASATSEDFATDALAAVTYLQGRRDISAVGIVGHSEGGMIGPMVAARSAGVSYVVMLAGPGLPGEELMLLQTELIARADGDSETLIAATREAQRRVFEIARDEPDPAAAAPRMRAVLQGALSALSDADRAAMGDEGAAALAAGVRQANSPWFRFLLGYDPGSVLEHVSVPVLALNGDKDLQVPADPNLGRVVAALHRGGNRDVTARVLPGLNHLFQTAATGSPAEYHRIAETISPTVLELVSSWIVARFGGSNGR